VELTEGIFGKEASFEIALAVNEEGIVFGEGIDSDRLENLLPWRAL
jgi:hypothetical protein